MQHALTRIESLIQQQAIPQLIDLCEEAELNHEFHSHSVTPTDPTPIYPILLLAYMIQDDMPLAKALIKRIPPLQHTPDLQHVHLLFTRLWCLDVAGFHQSLSIHSLSSLLQPLLELLVSNVRQRTFYLLAKSYSTIHPDRLCKELGCPTAVVDGLCQQQGWIFKQGYYYPKQQDMTAPPTQVPFNHTLNQLVKTSLLLEL